MMAARVEKALTSMKARLGSASRAVSKLSFPSLSSLSATLQGALDSIAQAKIFYAAPRKMHHEGGYQTTRRAAKAKDCRADIMHHQGEHETTRKAAKAKECKAVSAKTAQADYAIALRVSGATTGNAINAKTKRADHVLIRNAAGFEANRHAPLISCELASETEVDGASVMTAEPRSAHHEDTTVYGTDAAGLTTGQAIGGLLAELQSDTVSRAGLGGASITASVHATGQMESAQTATIFFWLPPIERDGALYIRMVHALPEQPEADEPVHIT